jgi:hypothetical protein
MRKIIGGIVAALALMMFNPGGASAASFGSGHMGGAPGVDPMIVRVYSSCGHLRHECREEEDRGYRGRACHAYEEECGHEHCERLRHACHEEREGEDHDGACHRYHEVCEER